MGKRVDSRRRHTLQIQLDVSHTEVGRENRSLVLYAEELKSQRKFKKVARDALMLHETLDNHDFTLLEKLFPAQYEHLKNQMRQEVLQNELLQKIDKMMAQRNQPQKGIMTFQPIEIDDDDDDLQLVVTKAKTIGGNAAQNFLSSMMALQKDEDKEQPKPKQGIQQIGGGSLSLPSFDDDDDDFLITPTGA